MSGGMMQGLNRQKEHSPIIVSACSLLIIIIENLNKERMKRRERKRIQEFRSGRLLSFTASK